jgi:hypothetical protein
MDEVAMSDRKLDRVPLVAPTTVTLPLGLVPEPKCLGLSIRTVNVIALGLSFCFLFTAFNPTQVQISDYTVYPFFAFCSQYSGGVLGTAESHHVIILK